MDFPFSQLYFICTLFTTFSFVYLIFRFFLTTSKQIVLQTKHQEHVQSLNDNITGIIDDFCFDAQGQNQAKNKDSSVVTPTAKKIIHKSQQRACIKGDHHRQCSNFDNNSGFLPFSSLGLVQMKQLNKKYVRENESSGFLGLVKQKKKKNLSNCVKKYGFHKTTLVTIYEQFQY